MTRRVLAGGALALLLLSSAAAQVPEQLFRDFFGRVLPQIQRQLIPPTVGPPRIAPSSPQASPAPVPQTDISISRPTFNCAKARSPLAVLICSDSEAAQADWDLVTASWARYFSLNESDRPRFTAGQDKWFASVGQKCKLVSQRPAYPREQISCVIGAYRGRAAAYRSKLTGDALAESKLSGEQLVQIQQNLIAAGFLSDEADGEFGPATRSAIRRYQELRGLQQSDYLSITQRQTLLGGSVGTTGMGGNQNAAPENRASAWQDSAARQFTRMAATGGKTWKECELADRDPDRSIAACSKLLRQGRAKAGAFHNRGLANAAKGNVDQAIAEGMSRTLLNIAKRSLPRLMLSGVGLASKDAV